MKIEAIKPLTVHLQDGDLDLEPGVPVNVSDDIGRKLLMKAQGVVRLVETADATVHTGHRVEWCSPLFGTCAGRVVVDSEDGWFLLKGEHTPNSLVWVREDRLNATR